MKECLKLISKKLRQEVLKNYYFTCARCEEQSEDKKGTGLHIALITPKEAGGEIKMENLMPLCNNCYKESKKRKKDPFSPLDEPFDMLFDE